MRILLSNDDGYFAPGLAALAKALEPLADITVVAPERNRSGASNSLTLDRPLSVRQAANGFYFVNGTPTDCVHLAVTGLLDDMPDMVISGINDGANMGDDTIYSGTVAAAIGGHVIKVGCAPYLIDWINRGLIQCVAMNGSAAIHDFELALAGKTSEDVAAQLPDGRFGMAQETAEAFVAAARFGWL